MKHTTTSFALLALLITAGCQTPSPRPPVRTDIPPRASAPRFRALAPAEVVHTNDMPVVLDGEPEEFLDTNALPKDFTSDGRYWVTLCSNGTWACCLQRSDNGRRSWENIKGAEEAVMTGDRWCLSMSDHEHKTGSEYRIKLRKRH